MNNNEIFKMADELKALKDRKKDLEADVKDLTARIDEVDSQLSDAMTNAECDRFCHNGNTFYLNTRLYASAAGGRKDEMIYALKNNGYGDIVAETVNANTLASFVKEQMAENADIVPAWLAQVVNTFEKTSVGIRRG